MDDRTACKFACGFFQEASRMSHMGCHEGEGLGRPTYTVIRRNLSTNLMKTARRKTKQVLFSFLDQSQNLGPSFRSRQNNTSQREAALSSCNSLMRTFDCPIRLRISNNLILDASSIRITPLHDARLSLGTGRNCPPKEDQQLQNIQLLHLLKDTTERVQKDFDREVQLWPDVQATGCCDWERLKCVFVFINFIPGTQFHFTAIELRSGEKPTLAFNPTCSALTGGIFTDFSTSCTKLCKSLRCVQTLHLDTQIPLSCPVDDHHRTMRRQWCFHQLLSRDVHLLNSSERSHLDGAGALRMKTHIKAQQPVFGVLLSEV